MTIDSLRTNFSKSCSYLAATLLILLWVSVVRGEAFFGITNNGIYKVDVGSGTFTPGSYATVVTFAVPVASGVTLATRPSDGMLFYLDSQAVNPNLWRFDPATPAVPPVLVGTTGIGVTAVLRLGFDAGGTLYAMDSASTSLFTLSTATGAVTTQTPTIGTTAVGGDICAHPTSGVLYVVATQQIYSVTTAGVITPIGGGTGTISGLPAGSSMTGCAFDQTGNLVVSLFNTGAATLYRINLSALSATSMGAVAGTPWGDIGTAPGRQADLSVTKTASNLAPGNTVTFTVTVSNAGPVRATGVHVNDLLPAGLTYVSGTASAGTYNSTTGLWDINVVNVGTPVTLTINATVATVGAKTNTAQLTFSDQHDPDSTPNNNIVTEDDQASVTVTPSADLQIVKTTTTGFAVGVIGRYSISVNNTLGSNATVGTYTVSDTFPPGITLAAPLPSGTGWACTGAVGDTSFTCSSSTVMAVGAANPNPITVNVLAAAAAAPSATNTATISGGGEPASNAGNNSSSVTHAVCATNCPDLRLTKTSPASFSVGVNSSYSISVNNTLGGIATFAPYSVTDTLPTGITLTAPASGTGWTCQNTGAFAAGGNQVSCTNSTALNAGTSNPNPITVNVAIANTAVPSVTNTANVSGGGEPTATQGNNGSSVVTTVLGFNLRMVKAGPASFSVGGTGTYTVTVDNSTGTLPTTGTYTVTDTLPAGLTLSAPASGTGWTCQTAGAFAAGGNQVSCTNATVIAAGGTNANAISIPVNVGAAAAPSVTNTATLTHPTEPPANATDNTAVVVIPVLAPDLFVTKGHAGDFSVGTIEAYTITVHNAGGLPTTGTITVVDTLPTGITFNSFTGTGWACSVTSAGPPQVVTCTRTTSIAASSSGPAIGLNVNVAAAAVAASPITNNVVVSGGNEPAGNTGNNTDSDVANAYYTPVIAKSFSTTPVTSPVQIVSGGVATLRLTISNPTANPVSLLGLAVTDPFPAGMTVDAVPAFSNTCGGTISTGTTQGDTQIVLAGGGPIAPGANCQIQVNVTRATVGTVTNTTSAVSSTNSGIGNAASANLVVNAPANLTLTKLSNPDPVGVGAPATLTFTFTNTATNPARSGLAFTDLFPTNVVLFDTTTSNTCGGTLTDNAGGALNTGDLGVRLSGGSMTSGTSSCQITVRIKSDTPGSYLNNQSRFSGVAASITLDVDDTLNVRGTTLTKAFSPSSIVPGGTSTLTFAIANGAGNPAQLGLGFTDTLPTNVSVVGPVTALQCNGTLSSSGPNNISFTGGTLATGSVNCTISVTVTSSVSGSYTNGTTNMSGLSVGMTNSANATLDVGVPVSGTVYSDVNHNGIDDLSEAGTGLTLYAKLIPSAAPGGPATQAVLVDPSTGVYSFPLVSFGNFIIVIDNNNSLSDVTPTIPAGWIGTEIPNQTRTGVVVGGPGTTNLNFGLFNGSALSGLVFDDRSPVAGAANNGVPNAGEPGIAGVTLQATHPSCPGSVCDTVVTNGAGTYQLWIPASVGNTSVSIVETNLSNYISTGAQVGATAGVYARLTDTVLFTNSVGSTYTGVNFGDVRQSIFQTDGLQNALAGTTIYYPHIFTANTTGTVTFSTTNVAAPANPGWVNTIYRDTNCNGALDGTEGSTTFSSVGMSAGQNVCILVREFVPAAATGGAQDVITVTASFAFANAAPALSTNHVHTDTTTVASTSSAGLQLVKSVDKSAALPNEILTYTITYTNTGTSPITSVVVNDSTPAFTVYVGASAGCPALIIRTTCTVTSEPANNASGSVVWTITGSVGAGASSTVQYQVRVQP
jgi:mucin-19